MPGAGSHYASSRCDAWRAGPEANPTLYARHAMLCYSSATHIISQQQPCRLRAAALLRHQDAAMTAAPRVQNRSTLMSECMCDSDVK